MATLWSLLFSCSVFGLVVRCLIRVGVRQREKVWASLVCSCCLVVKLCRARFVVAMVKVVTGVSGGS